MEYGCIGEHLSHSFSREIHRRIGDYPYVLQEVEKEKLQEFMEARSFRGINVTVPYKVDVLPFLHSIDAKAADIGAVNTIVNRDGRLLGYNTDFDGMTALLRKIGLEPGGKKVLILGTGGTSRTASAVMQALGAERITRVSRSRREGCITYEQAAADFADTQLIINTTPCGMYPHTEAMPIDPAGFPALEGVLDVIYNPLRSVLVQKTRALGKKAGGGLYMLAAQAVYAAEHFFDRPFPAAVIDRVYAGILQEKENIVLVGMPGSGKSTVGRLLAEKLGMEFLDTDRTVTQACGSTPAELIRTRGEAAFRALETGVLEQLHTRSGCVIATGGGAVLKEENVGYLRANGRLFFLDRPLEQLIPTADRPLSADREALARRFAERYDRYCAVSDVRIGNSGTAAEAADAIISRREEQAVCVY